MPDYRPDAPWVDLFTADEHLVVCDWFGLDAPRSGCGIDHIIDEWGIPDEIPGYRRVAAAVAQILLERIQDGLPNWTAVVGDRFVAARPILDRRAHRRIELWPRHLLTINWADSGPGFSWPVAYNAIYVPVFDSTVVTASADCPEALGVCDVAIGAFGSEISVIEGSRRIITSDWARQRRDHEQQRWAYLFGTGIVSKAEAQAWADQVCRASIAALRGSEAGEPRLSGGAYNGSAITACCTATESTALSQTHATESAAASNVIATTVTIQAAMSADKES